MKIVSAKVIVCSPGRNFVTLKIETDQGIYGLGDATLNGRELAVASYLEDHLIPCLIGRDPFQTEDIWHYFYRGAYWRRGPVTMTAIAAIDMALWDIKGKALGVPVYNLLGGKSRNSVMVYAHATGRDIAETVDEVERYRALGYLAIRAQSGVPGLKSTYGVAKDQQYYEPAERGLPSESLWSTEKYLRHVPKLFEALRSTLFDGEPDNLERFVLLEKLKIVFGQIADRAPLRIALSCGPSASPPTTSAAGISCLPRSASNCSATCMASSRVGNSTSAPIPGTFRWTSFSITGMRNASVLPVPV